MPSLYVIEEFVVAFFIYQRADTEEEQRVANGKTVHNKARNFAVENYASEVLDINENGIQME